MNTGGDSGIGRAAASAFAREGAHVAINYLPPEESDAREVVALIKQAGRKAMPIPGDIRQESFCQQLVSQAVQDLGGLDILVNNAARQVAKSSILEISSEQFDTTLKTNLYALFWITKAALPHMAPGSAIVNTASINSYDPQPEILDYATTKGGIAIFTKLVGILVPTTSAMLACPMSCSSSRARRTSWSTAHRSLRRPPAFSTAGSSLP